MNLQFAPNELTWTERGSSAYRRISIALFLAGFATFSLIYCVQPLLPAFAQDFHVGAAESSLALSLTTGFLAIAILCVGAGSEMLGRRGLMFASMGGAAILNPRWSRWRRAGTPCSSSGRWRALYWVASRRWLWPISPRRFIRTSWAFRWGFMSGVQRSGAFSAASASVR